jgi:membrane protein
MRYLTRRLKRAWLFLVRLQREFGYDDCMGMAAQIAFYNILGLFPLMIFLLNIIGLFPLGRDLQPKLLKELGEQMPPEAAGFVVDTVLGLVPNANRGLFGVVMFASLWGASMATGAMITTINRAYNIRPRRNLFQQKILSMWLTLVLAVLWLAAFVIVLQGPRVTQNVFELMGIASETNTFWTSVRLPMAFVLTLISLSILYYIAPEAKQRFRWILPGAIAAAVLWLGASSGFGVFLRKFNNYDATYGSLAGLVILMVWFWLSGVVFLLGAEVNSLMKRMDAEHHHPRPKRRRFFRRAHPTP